MTESGQERVPSAAPLKEEGALSGAIDRALGGSDDFIIEHRCYNGICLAAGFGCVIGSILDIFNALSPIVIITTFVTGIVYWILYFDSRKSEEYRPKFVVYIGAGSLLLALTWVFIGGANGSGVVVSMVALVALTAVLKSRRLLLVFTVFFPLMTVLFLVHIFSPDLIIPYQDEKQRIIDIYITFVIATTVISSMISLLLNNSDRERRRLDEVNRMLEERMEELNRANAELEDALDRVDTLSGLLPICASCKKVRDDQGYWRQIESYIRKHSRADFTHGICPDCVKELYPDLGKPE